MISGAYLQSADVVELSLFDNKYQADIDIITSIVCGKSIFGLPYSTTKIEELINKKYNVTAIIGNMIDVVLEDGVECTFTVGKKDIIFSETTEHHTFGFVIDNNGFPFVAYPSGDEVKFVYYGALKDSVVDAYRHLSANNEFFRTQLVYNTLMGDLTAHMEGNTSAWEASMTFLGNTSLNYIMLVFGLLGTEYPSEWAKTGAPKDIITDFRYGFRKV